MTKYPSFFLPRSCVHFEFIYLCLSWKRTANSYYLFGDSFSMAAATTTNHSLPLMFLRGTKLRCPFMSTKCLLFEPIPLWKTEQEINTEIKILLASPFTIDQSIHFFHFVRNCFRCFSRSYCILIPSDLLSMTSQNCGWHLWEKYSEWAAHEWIRSEMM